MPDFNVDAFISGSQAPPADPANAAQPTLGAAAPPPVAAQSSAFDVDRFINGGQATDKLTGTSIPLPLSGNTPETAQNKSPLSAADRLKLSLGNEKGNIQYLKQRYQDAQVVYDDHGKPTKEIAIKDGSTWYRVNPKNGDIQDPWERTKEYLKDAASYAPEALGVGVAAATDVMTGGASIPESAAIAGGTTAAVRTSLGRIVGTYDATPAEQAYDIGFESLLNAAGAKIIAGVKPSAKYVADKLPEMAAAFRDTVEPYIPTAAKSAASMASDAGGAVASGAKGLLKKVLVGYSVGENNFDTMVDNTERVRGAMKNLSDMTGGDVAAYHDEALRSQTGAIRNIADNARTTLSSIYGQMRNKILATVPDKFSVNLEDPVYSAYSKALQNGIGVLQVGGRELTGQQALEHIAENGMKNSGFRMLTQDELAMNIAKGGSLGNGVGSLATDKEAHSMMKEFYDNLGKFTGGQNRSGVEGARALMDFKKVAGDLSYKLANSETGMANPQIRMLINEAKTSMDDAVYQGLKQHGVGDQFLKMNSTYDSLAEKFQPLLNAQKQFQNSENPKVYEGLLNTFLSRPGKNASARFAIDEAIAAADSNGLKSLSAKLLDDKTHIQVMEAAKAFNPLSPSKYKAVALNTSQLGMGVYLMTHPNPAMIAAALGVKAVTSPAVTSTGIAAVQGLSQGQQMLSQMSKTQLDKFLSSPEAINMFTTGITQAPLVRAQAEQGIQSAIMSKMQEQQQIQEQQMMKNQQLQEQGK